jgi:hypothetical protein
VIGAADRQAGAFESISQAAPVPLLTQVVALVTPLARRQRVVCHGGLHRGCAVDAAADGEGLAARLQVTLTLLV